MEIKKCRKSLTYSTPALFLRPANLYSKSTQTRARTGMGCPTGVWDQRVYRFRHLGLSGCKDSASRTQKSPLLCWDEACSRKTGCKITQKKWITSNELWIFYKKMRFSCNFVIIFVISQREIKSIRDITWKSTIRIIVLFWLAVWDGGCGLPAGRTIPSSS